MPDRIGRQSRNRFRGGRSYPSSFCDFPRELFFRPPRPDDIVDFGFDCARPISIPELNHGFPGDLVTAIEDGDVVVEIFLHRQGIEDLDTALQKAHVLLLRGS